MIIRNFVYALFTVVLPVISGALDADAADWSLNSRLRQKLNYDDNLNLSPDPNGDVYGSLSDLYADLAAESRIDRWDLIGELGYQAYAGPGSAFEADHFLPYLDLKYKRSNKTTTLNTTASYIRETISSIDLIDLATFPGGKQVLATTLQDTFNVGANLDYAIDRSDKLTWSSSGRTVSFSGGDSGLSPADYLTSALTWGHELSRNTNAKATLGIDWQSIDNDEQTQQLTYRARGDLEVQLSHRLKANGGLGVRLVNTSENIADDGDSRESSLGFGPTAKLGFSYGLKSTHFFGSATYDIQPNSFGDLQDRTYFGVGLLHDINEVSHFTINMSYTMASNAASGGGSGSGNASVIEISPVYTWTFAPEWDLQLGYNYAHSDQGGGTANENDIYVQISRSLVLDP